MTNAYISMCHDKVLGKHQPGFAVFEAVEQHLLVCSKGRISRTKEVVWTIDERGVWQATVDRELLDHWVWVGAPI